MSLLFLRFSKRGIYKNSCKNSCKIFLGNLEMPEISGIFSGAKGGNRTNGVMIQYISSNGTNRLKIGHFTAFLGNHE